MWHGKGKRHFGGYFPRVNESSAKDRQKETLLVFTMILLWHVALSLFRSPVLQNWRHTLSIMVWIEGLIVAAVGVFPVLYGVRKGWKMSVLIYLGFALLIACTGLGDRSMSITKAGYLLRNGLWFSLPFLFTAVSVRLLQSKFRVGGSQSRL